MRQLIIAGAGGFGREVLSYAKDIINANQCDWTIKGFVDDDLASLDAFDTGPIRILDTIDNYQIEQNDVFVCAIGLPTGKKAVVERLLSRGARFINFIHPTARIMDRAEIGKGLIMCPFSSIGPDTCIGNFVTINGYSGIGHDASVGDYTVLSSHCDVTGFCKVGQGVMMGSRVSVVPKRKIGDNASLSAGSVVFNHVRPDTVVYGNPAKRLK